MRKTIFALATLALFALEAEQFQVKTSISSPSADAPEYLVQFEIDQINENSPPVEFSKPSIVCQLGKEEEVNKFVEEQGGYTVKALVYQAEDKTKVKTSVTILDATKKEIFHSNEEKELGASS
ncbi:MAG TPA: hypothetical protein VHK67_00215 [Rhabdochlamydiaceae bacterium]|jgi:hypothetical protein|nr:hypothetical protein [Rhabdochlamydiaceae bacterium]